jgi:hypothetical protein
MDEITESQAVVEPEAPQDGEAQPMVEPEATQSGAEETTSEPPKPVKTYTQEEVAEREAKIMSQAQAEAEQYRQYAAQVAMQQEISRLQAKEREAQAKDQKEVTDGYITPEIAEQRRNQRMEEERARRAYQALEQKGNDLARILLAQELGNEYGIDFNLLLKDKTIRTDFDMSRKAAKLAIEAREEKIRAAAIVPETFDKGPAGGVVGDFSKMSPEEKIQWALKHQK